MRMKKYRVIFGIAWERALAYRGINAIYTLLFLLNTVLAIAVWSVAMKNPQFQAKESFSTFITYFLLVIVLHQFVQSYTGGFVAEDHIKRGELSVYLLKPFPYIVYILLLELPWRIIQGLLSIPAAIVLYAFFRDAVVFNLSMLGLVLLIVPFCLLVSFFIQIIFAFLAFWFEDTHGFFSVLETSSLLFMGTGIPIFFFPSALQVVGRILPFQYILYFPVSVAMQRLSSVDTRYYAIILLGWVAGLGLVAYAMWQRGLRRFTGEGI